MGRGAAPPAFIDVPPALISDLLIIAAIVFDWRMRGKPHPVYLWGGAAILLMQLTRVPIAGSAARAGCCRLDWTVGRVRQASPPIARSAIAPLIPAKAGIQRPQDQFHLQLWIPAFAGMSGKRPKLN